MKIYKKIIMLIFSTFILTLMACSNDISNNNGGGGGRDQTTRKKTLTYLISVESPVYQNILRGVIDDFNELIEDEGYKIETETPGGDYYTSLGSKFSANQAPDIFMIELGYFNAYNKYGYLEPLDNYLENSSILNKDDLWDINDYYRYDSKTNTQGEGNLYSLIKDFSPDFMLIYNKSLLNSYNNNNPQDQIEISDEIALSWHEFYEIVSKIQAYTGTTYGTSIGFEPTKHLHQMVQQTGSWMYTSDGKGFNGNDQKVKDAIAFFAALQKDNAVEFPDYYELNHNNGKAPASFTSGSSTSEMELFKQQRAFSVFNGLYSFSANDLYNLNFELGIAPSPTYEGGNNYSTTSAMVSHAISSKSRYKDIAWRFLEYLQTEGLSRLATIGFNIPGNKTVASSSMFLENDNKKMEAMNNYFYNYVNEGHVYPIIYNPNASFSTIETIFNTQFVRYYDNQLSFENLITNLDNSIKNLIG